PPPPPLPPPPPPGPGLEIWDTGKPSSEPLAPAALEAKAGWTKVAEPGAVKGDAVLTNGRDTAAVRKHRGTVPDPGAFKGDAVLPNGRLTAVIRKAGGTALYGASAARARAILQAASGE